MSRIGRKPIEVPKDVNIALVDNNVNVKGKLGELSFKLRSTIKVELNDNMIQVSRQSDEKKNRELHGLTRSIIQNMIIGVSEGFKKELELNGVGFTT